MGVWVVELGVEPSLVLKRAYCPVVICVYYLTAAQDPTCL
jgi:hypothetical protein